MSDIATAAELDTLPVGSVVTDAAGHVFFQHADGDDLPGRGWVCEDGERWSTKDVVGEADPPLDVVYRPDAPVAAGATVTREQIRAVVHHSRDEDHTVESLASWLGSLPGLTVADADPELLDLSLECPLSERVDGPLHSWRFDGDDPYVICHYCGEVRDTLNGRVIKAGRKEATR